MFRHFPDTVGGQLKVRWTPEISSLVFKLHYKYTYIVYIVSMALSTLYDILDITGDKIQCMTEPESHKKVVENYCFIMGTFTVDHLHNATVGVDVPHPGVGIQKPGDAITVHSYYQWVPFVLFINGVLFRVPHWMWKGYENGLFKEVIQKLNIKNYLADNLKGWNNRDQQYKVLSDYLQEQMHQHHFWCFKFFFFEALNLVVAVFTLFFTDYFLGGEFLTYGSKVFEFMNMDPEDRLDPMSYVFPRMAKCTFRLWGPSGTIMVRDVMCLIATNIINEKIFVFIWVWLVILITVTSLWMVWRILILALQPLRSFILWTYAYQSTKEVRDTIMEHCTISDWFLLIHLRKNMDNNLFIGFIEHLAKDIEKKGSKGTSELYPLMDIEESANTYRMEDLKKNHV